MPSSDVSPGPAQHRQARAVLVVLLMLSASSAFSQGTALTYQGRLSAAGAPATGTYEMLFTLYDALDAGAAVGPVQVSGGLFSIEQLDFGDCAECFPGVPRYLEIALRPAGSPDAYVRLQPREPLTATPYAIRAASAGTAANAAQLEGLPASGFIRNSAAAQPGDFNVSGNGTLGGNLTVSGSLSLAIVNAETRYDLAGPRLLAAGGPASSNLSLGFGAGDALVLHADNTFVGQGAGAPNSGDFNCSSGSRPCRSSWAYKADATGARHVGPMAQDFAAAFGLGSDDTHIAPSDLAGVSLAAVQALNHRLEGQIRQLSARVAQLEARPGQGESCQ